MHRPKAPRRSVYRNPRVLQYRRWICAENADRREGEYRLSHIPFPNDAVMEGAWQDKPADPQQHRWVYNRAGWEEGRGGWPQKKGMVIESVEKIRRLSQRRRARVAKWRNV